VRLAPLAHFERLGAVHSIAGPVPSRLSSMASPTRIPHAAPTTAALPLPMPPCLGGYSSRGCRGGCLLPAVDACHGRRGGPHPGCSHLSWGPQGILTRCPPLRLDLASLTPTIDSAATFPAPWLPTSVCRALPCLPLEEILLPLTDGRAPHWDPPVHTLWPWLCLLPVDGPTFRDAGAKKEEAVREMQGFRPEDSTKPERLKSLEARKGIASEAPADPRSRTEIVLSDDEEDL